MKYAKPALTFDQQVQLLITRGMVVADPQRAAHYLSHINYYRFAGYVLPFEADHLTHQFRRGTRFDDVLNLYVFDRELRLLVLDAIERIEVSVRTQWAYHFAHVVSPHGYLERANSASIKQLARQLVLISAVMDESKEAFVAHHRTKYTDPDLPPIWVACELLSLGQLSQWYTMLRPMGLRKQIAKAYLMDQQVLQSVLQHLTYVRNICAHHARLWNREFVVTSSLPRKGLPLLLAAIDDRASRQIYNTLCLIVHLMDCINPGHSWRERLVTLLDTHKADLTAMGFPADWATRDLWKGDAP
jgi:abortive infection bacteriophage resistance protein